MKYIKGKGKSMTQILKINNQDIKSKNWKGTIKEIQMNFKSSRKQYNRKDKTMKMKRKS